MKMPHGSVIEPPRLNYMAVEISKGAQWVNLNDSENFKISAEGTRDQGVKTWRKTVAESPVLGGNYLIHAVPDMVAEQMGLWVYGQDQTDLADNLFYAMELFEQMDFRIRWTFDEYREYWRCQLGEVSWARGHVLTHNHMAQLNVTIPRYPDIARERIG